MKPKSIFNFTTISLFGLAAQTASASPAGSAVTANPPQPSRQSILNRFAAQADLPTADQARAAAEEVGLDLDDIQGDILIGMKKKQEIFSFFSIEDVDLFKSALHDEIQSLITSTNQMLSVATQPEVLLNIAFSQSGLSALGIGDSLGDLTFSQGQAADATNLGDPGTANWVSAFAGTSIHGVFLLASDTMEKVEAMLVHLQTTLSTSVKELHRLPCSERPGPEAGHEHFGYMDGISQPGIIGFTPSSFPGQQLLDAGHFLLGETGDTLSATRPAWAKDGSFLAFRQLEQRVPEFQRFLDENPIIESGLTPQQGSDLLGARMVGRWKSGAPVDLAPLFDDPGLAADPQRNNNFTFAHPGEDIRSNQTRCPFSAHVRKTNPRDDLTLIRTIPHHIIRSGIPYGPEVTAAESASGMSDPGNPRGLAFVAYQSDIGNGFRFLQQSWASNPNFVVGKSDPTPGFDPIIGANGGQARFVSGLDPTNSSRDFTLLTDFVFSRGGEYFFSPSISAINKTISV